MTSAGANKLYNIKAELRSIITELESISDGVRNNFHGIGNARCADCIDIVIEKYYGVLNRLNNMDTNAVTQEFLDRQAAAAGGGDGGGGMR